MATGVAGIVISIYFIVITMIYFQSEKPFDVRKIDDWRILYYIFQLLLMKFLLVAAIKVRQHGDNIIKFRSIIRWNRFLFKI